MSRATWVKMHRREFSLAYKAITFYGGAFQHASAKEFFAHSCSASRRRTLLPRYTDGTTPDCLASHRFGLFPFRSPLLRESLSLSFPRDTEMFHFSRCPPRLFDKVTSHERSRVSPFGHPRC